jgi:signal transduction histidine kinase
MQGMSTHEFKRRYAEALRDHLGGRGEAALQQGYELGRLAVADEIGLIDLIAVHQEVLGSILPESETPDGSPGTLEAAGRFLRESVAPFEMTHRGFREAVETLRRVNELLEEEARRIAHALHDDAGQLLVSVHLALREVAAGLPPQARARLERLRGPLDEIEKHLRRMSHELRPTILDDLGLMPALEFLAQGVGARADLPITVTGPRAPRMPPRVELAIYRVVQEALRNAVRHSQATQVDVRLDYEVAGVRCSIRDDGRGFDLASVLNQKGRRGLGLLGMRERLNALGGLLSIDSAPGRGTEVQVAIPIGDHDAHTHSSR